MKRRLSAFCFILGLICLAATLVACGQIFIACSTLGGVNIFPGKATADHSGIPPANQVQFTAFPAPKSGCLFVATNISVVWTTSDTLNTTITAPQNSFNGLATCLHATTGPVTITGTASDGTTGGATLICK